MTKMQETGRTDTAVYAASMIVCGNDEEIAGVGSADPTGNGWADEAREAHGAAVAVIEKAGYDYDTESNFRDWNGGRYHRKARVHVRWWRADIEGETERSSARACRRGRGLSERHVAAARRGETRSGREAGGGSW